MGGETLTERSRIPPLLAVVLAVGLLASSLAATRPAAAQSVHPTVTIEVVRIAEGDPLDLPPTGDWDWFYWLGAWNGSAYVWTRYEAPNGINVTVGATHAIEARAPVLQFVFILCEGDTFTAHDVADISSVIGGGADDTTCPVGPLLPTGAYQGTWDLRSDTLGGDAVVVDAEGYRASGDLDGNTGVDENDANFWFRISDDYARPVAAAGPDVEGWLNDSFVFDGRGSTATNASLETYEWDFDGDGAPDATGALAVWRFAAKGAHTVSLTVTDSLGQDATDEAIVTIRNREPTARFVYLPAEPETGDPVRFGDASTDVDGNVAAWSWSFGDSGTSAERDPTHAFTEARTYTVTLTVTDDGGGTHSVSRTVTVRPAAEASPVSWFAIALVLSLVVLAAALYLWWRKSPPAAD
ncbi:MAG: PKD domain-containing protein [Candidatus Thermoplasmatota archaeon]